LVVQVVPHLVHAIFGCATVGRSVQLQTWLASREAKEILSVEVNDVGEVLGASEDKHWKGKRPDIGYAQYSLVHGQRDASGIVLHIPQASTRLSIYEHFA
jgi:hypothetical protein